MKTYLFNSLQTSRPEQSYLLARLPCKLSVGTIISSLVPSNVYLTIDGCLVVFTVQDDKQMLCERLDTFKEEFKVKDKVVCLAYVKQGMLFNSTKELRLTFESQGDVDIFKASFSKVIECLR